MKSLKSLLERAFDEASTVAAQESAVAADKQHAAHEREQEKKKESAKLDHQFEKSQYYASRALDAQNGIVCAVFEFDEWRVNMCARCGRHAIEHFDKVKPRKLAREQQKRREQSEQPYLSFTLAAEALAVIAEVERKLGIPKKPVEIDELKRARVRHKKRRKEGSTSTSSTESSSDSSEESLSSRRRRPAGLSSKSRVKPKKIGRKRPPPQRPIDAEQRTARVLRSSRHGSAIKLLSEQSTTSDDESLTTATQDTVSLSVPTTALSRLQVLSKAQGLSDVDCLRWLLDLGQQSLQLHEDRAMRLAATADTVVCSEEEPDLNQEEHSSDIGVAHNVLMPFEKDAFVPNAEETDVAAHNVEAPAPANSDATSDTTSNATFDTISNKT